jgi:tRNA A37 methylthiotransferase MiaB
MRRLTWLSSIPARSLQERLRSAAGDKGAARAARRCLSPAAIRKLLLRSRINSRSHSCHRVYGRAELAEIVERALNQARPLYKVSPMGSTACPASGRLGDDARPAGSARSPSVHGRTSSAPIPSGPEVFEETPVERPRLTRAFLKIQEGAATSAPTASCRTPGGRPARGRPAGLAEAEMLVAKGYKEIVLTGTHIGLYGKDNLHLRSDNNACAGMTERLAGMERSDGEIPDTRTAGLRSVGRFQAPCRSCAVRRYRTTGRG